VRVANKNGQAGMGMRLEREARCRSDSSNQSRHKSGTLHKIDSLKLTIGYHAAAPLNITNRR
jgi:hypothetical protein